MATLPESAVDAPDSFRDSAGATAHEYARRMHTRRVERLHWHTRTYQPITVR
ncbi:MAG: hypothetical protein R6U20_09455 [Longimonas sp.]|uniref:hypothetical protein n=1 Tax=Longimonas sp. TaxID=2039626 RepID=UPI0039762168